MTPATGSKGFGRRSAIFAVAGILAALLLVIQLASGGWGLKRRETQLRTDLVEIREALDAYEAEHGFHPCEAEDFNHEGDSSVFVRQLTQFTDEHGEPSPTRNDRFRFGPYIDDFPPEAITETPLVIVNQQTDRPLPELGQAVLEGTGHGGWYYEAQSGNIVPNLGADYEKPYALF